MIWNVTGQITAVLCIGYTPFVFARKKLAKQMQLPLSLFLHRNVPVDLCQRWDRKEKEPGGIEQKRAAGVQGWCTSARGKRFMTTDNGSFDIVNQLRAFLEPFDPPHFLIPIRNLS